MLIALCQRLYYPHPPSLSLSFPHSLDALHLCDKSRLLDLTLVFVCGGARGAHVSSVIVVSSFATRQPSYISPSLRAIVFHPRGVLSTARAPRGAERPVAFGERVALQQRASCVRQRVLLFESVSEVVNHNETEALQPLSL